MSRTLHYLALDIGERRVGVASADSAVGIAVPYDTLEMNEETFRHDIAQLVTRMDIDTIIIGYPRNQSGEPTAQTHYVEGVAEQLCDLDADIVFQDESLTSVMAKDRLGANIKRKGDIDAEAATIILQDYIEEHR